MDDDVRIERIPIEELNLFLDEDKDVLSFSDDFKDYLFYIWYNSGQPTYGKFWSMLPKEDILNQFPAILKFPTKPTLSTWIREEFRPRAEELDEQVKVELDVKAVEEKIKMMERHTKIAIDMQELSIKYLDAHKDELTPSSAVRLLVEAIELEKISRGIPEALRKMTTMTDEELTDEIKKLMTTNVIVKPIDDKLLEGEEIENDKKEE